ncbi:helix-turn-helix transcriptional regulator [Clostridium sp. D33t1_170424_F3]|uniref:helix-turn-helix domain-containing protein n=1 Tax=Clostridium sp. D33t1_170424_F3 TaxID=2787099 RepID=UPI0018A8B3F2|nr:helix-turn-helix transcriptional regulator [Clostridium sp. D33t1_170424_F3]
MENNNIHLCRNLRTLRRYHRLSQRAVAAFLEVDRSTYSYYERGSSEPPLKKLAQLAELFGVSLDTLVFGGLSDLFSTPAPTPNIDCITADKPPAE